MNVLVTGGYGFIGSAVARRFFEEGAKIYIIDNLSTGHLRNIDFEHKSYLLNVEDEVCEHFFKEVAFDVVIHCAAQTSVQNSMHEPVKDILTNIVGLSQMLFLSSKYKVKHFVFASSAAVYGDSHYPPLDENDISEPVSMYGLNKSIGETYCEKWQRDYHLPTLIYRFANVFGPSQSMQGEAAVIPSMLKSIIEGKPFTIYGEGEQSRDFIYVDDIADAIYAGVEVGLKGTYNVSTNEAWSIHQVILLLQHLNHPLEIQYAPSREGDIEHSFLNNEKLAKAIGWRPKISFAEGIERTLQALQSEKIVEVNVIE
ncbi:NAD-dependent epimerase/dehydratase family protein [Lysinibacillus parviboronicapiens]|uniref:NAD-dependent epimerase/dehydratase family protein n=1 Tax=Lysinibacillus parviboronicapiens TaxID=436516 RepID=UPI000D38D4FC|nr:NAD-dependent epimerase/dehydratase family protein [Lysinibacillus parviboronicapiens]